MLSLLQGKAYIAATCKGSGAALSLVDANKPHSDVHQDLSGSNTCVLNRPDNKRARTGEGCCLTTRTFAFSCSARCSALCCAYLQDPDEKVASVLNTHRMCDSWLTLMNAMLYLLLTAALHVYVSFMCMCQI